MPLPQYRKCEIRLLYVLYSSDGRFQDEDPALSLPRHDYGIMNDCMKMKRHHPL